MHQRRGTDNSTSSHALPRLSSTNITSHDPGDHLYSHRKSSVILPKLVDEGQMFSHVINRSRGGLPPPSMSRSAELNSYSTLEGQQLGPRSSSVGVLPNLSFSLSQGLIINSYVSGSSPVESDESDDDGDIDAPTPMVSIESFPNVDVESPFLFQDTITDKVPRPPTPPKRKTKKKKKPEDDDAKKRKNRSKRLSRKRAWKPQQQTAVNRRRDHEVSRRYPVRKQFLYSEILDDELKSYIPPRQPGGKLKPIYKRDPANGDIYIPETPIEIAFERLNSGGRPEIETAAMINKRRREELQALLERRKKSIGKKKRRKRVRFRLPKSHVPSDSDDDDDESDDESERSSVKSSEDHLKVTEDHLSSDNPAAPSPSEGEVAASSHDSMDADAVTSGFEPVNNSNDENIEKDVEDEYKPIDNNILEDSVFTREEHVL